MKKKFGILLFGLLLAVGWTNLAQAQLLAEPITSRAPYGFVYLGKSTVVQPTTEAPIEMTDEITVQPEEGSRGQMLRAPRRADYTVTSSAVHPRSWYTRKSYTWYDANDREHTASFTDTVRNPYQMYWFTRALYLNDSIPGIKYSETRKEDVIYRGNDFGYFISGPITEDIVISMTGNVQINGATVYDLEGNEITSYFASSPNLPTGWSMNTSTSSAGGPTRGYDDGYYYWSWVDESTSSYRIFTISKDLLTGHDGVQILVRAKQNKSASPTRDYTFNVWYDPVNRYAGEKHLLKSTWDVYQIMYTFPITTPPIENGYTVAIVKLSGKTDPLVRRPVEYTYTVDDLYTYFDDYIGEMTLLTDGLRVGENTNAAGTVFAYQGVLDKFFFISKGKTYPIATSYSCSENYWTTSNNNYERHADRAPFYSMYEEFSPDVAGSGASHLTDVYADMKTGQYYHIVHDCQGVMYLRHYFSMAGQDSVAPKAVAPLVFYIPDERGDSVTRSRTYEEAHQPLMGLYTIQLAAETEPSETYDQDSTYTVYLDWTSTLNSMVNNTVNQTYVIYTVETDSLGNRIYHPLDTVYDVTTYQYDVPQTLASQQITYVIMGYPTDATNNPDVQQGGIFFTYSNPDDVQIPGLFDFMRLYRERYESDFIIHAERNYYRNYLYPTNLSPGTGMTMRQLKKEWPNQTASYTLWRDNIGVAKLEIMGIGKKVYYRIRYYEATQDTTETNDIALPYDYQKMPNNN